MAKKTAVVTPQTTDAGNVGGLANGQVETDNAKEANKALISKMKSIGLDSKGLYTEYTNSVQDATDTIDFMVSKKKLTADDKTAILAMFAAMAAANAPKVKIIKEIPQDLAQAWKTAYDARQQFYAEKTAAYLAFDKIWNDKQAESKSAIAAARTTVETAGFYVKGDAVVATKSGSTTSTGEHGNAGKTKLSIGWTINVGTVTYSGWKDVAEKLVPSVFKGEVNTNYLANTAVLDKIVEMGLPIEIWAKISVKDHDHDFALAAWEKSAAKAKLDAHPSITVHVS